MYGTYAHAGSLMARGCPSRVSRTGTPPSPSVAARSPCVSRTQHEPRMPVRPPPVLASVLASIKYFLLLAAVSCFYCPFVFQGINPLSFCILFPPISSPEPKRVWQAHTMLVDCIRLEVVAGLWLGLQRERSHGPCTGACGCVDRLDWQIMSAMGCRGNGWR